MIQVLTLDDFEAVKQLWKENPKNFSVPYTKELTEILESNQYFGIYQNNELICMGGFKIMKRNPEIRLIHLCVKKEFRGQGLGILMVRHISDEVEKLNSNLEFCCYYRQGAKNNTFWAKYLLKEPTLIEKKTMCTYRGILDINKIRN